MVVQILALISIGQAALPKSAADIAGRYVLHGGFENYTYRFILPSKLVVEYRPDHPGGRNWVGIWKLDQGIIHATLSFKSGGEVRTQQYQMVPIVWGDRCMLADPEDIMSGRLQELFRRIGKPVGKRKFGDSHTDLMLPTRLSGPGSQLPKIYGKPRAPEPFQSLLDGIG